MFGVSGAQREGGAAGGPSECGFLQDEEIVVHPDDLTQAQRSQVNSQICIPMMPLESQKPEASMRAYHDSDAAEMYDDSDQESESEGGARRKTTEDRQHEVTVKPSVKKSTSAGQVSVSPAN